MTPTLSHDEVRSNMVAYLDRQLTPEARRMMNEHLRGCMMCQDELKAIGKAQQKIAKLMHAQLDEIHAAPDAWERLQAQLRTVPDASHLLGGGVKPMPISMNGHRGGTTARQRQTMQSSLVVGAFSFAFVMLIFVGFIGLVIVPALRGRNEVSLAPTSTAQAATGTQEATTASVTNTPLAATPTREPGGAILATATVESALPGTLTPTPTAIPTVSIPPVQPTQATAKEWPSVTVGLGVLTDAAISADGKMIVASTANGVLLIDATTLTTRWSVRSDASVGSIAVSPDGTRIAAGTYGLVDLWDAATGTRLNRFEDGGTNIMSVAFSPDGTMVAGASFEQVGIWNVSTGKLVDLFQQKDAFLADIEFSPDSTGLAVGGDGGWSIWNIATHAWRMPYLTGKHTNDLAFLSNTQIVTDSQSDGNVHIWDANTGAAVRELPTMLTFLEYVGVGSDGTVLASDGYSYLTKMQADSGIEMRYWLLDNGPSFLSVFAFSPAGDKLVYSNGEALVLMDLANDKEIGRLDQVVGTQYGVAFSPEGSTFATGAGRGNIRIWDSATGQVIRTLQNSQDRYIDLYYLPQGNILVTGEDYTENIKLWDITTGAVIRTLTAPAIIDTMAVSPDGKYVAAQLETWQILVWDANSGNLLQTIAATPLSGHPNDLRFSIDGSLLMAAAYEGLGSGKTIIWKWSSAQQINALSGPEGMNSWRVDALADGQRVVTGYSDGTVRLWNLASGDLLATLNGPSSPVESLAHSNDGKWIAAGLSDGSIHVWNATTLEQVALLDGHNGSVNGLAFSPNGKTMISISDDGTMRIWAVQP